MKATSDNLCALCISMFTNCGSGGPSWPSYSLHGLDEAKASQQQVTVKFQDLHGFHHIVFSDNVLHTNPRPLIFSR